MSREENVAQAAQIVARNLLEKFNIVQRKSTFVSTFIERSAMKNELSNSCGRIYL